MEKSISHNRNEETPEAKTRWFKSLSLCERMEVFCAYTDLALSLNPKIIEAKHVKPPKQGILILSKTPG